MDNKINIPNGSIKDKKTLTFPALASLTLAACGGGGGGGALITPAPPTNRAPTTGGTTTLTTDEDSIDVALGIATPTDADGDNLTITVTGLPTGGTLTTADGTEVTNNMTLSISQLTGLIFTPDANLNDSNTDFGSFTYSVSDGSLTSTGTVNISVTPVNDAPEFTSGPDLNIEENHSDVTGFTATDIDNDALTYSISGGTDQAFFTIDAATGALTFIDRPDFENAQDSDANNIYVVEITIDDGNGGTATQTFNIVVSDVVTGITISNSSIDENSSGVVVGDLTAAIDDLNATHEYTYALSGADAESFEIVNGQLKLKDSVTANYEVKNSYSVTVTATDSGGLSTSNDFTVTVNDVNDAPTGVNISRTGLMDNTDAAVVGILTTVDEDTVDNHTYTVSDDRFEVADGVLRLKAGQSIDNLVESTVTLTVTSTDKGGVSVQQEYILTVGTIQITSTQFEENAVGAVIGDLSVIDDSSFSGDITYTISGEGSENFEVVDGQLKLKDTFSANYEVLSSYQFTVTATDSSGYIKSTTYPFSVTDINDAPTGTSLSNMTFDENALGGVVGNLTTTDEDSGDTHTYTIPGFYGAYFEVVNGQLKLKDNIYYNYETTSGPLTITVTSTDSGGLSTTSDYAITINDLNDKPTAVNLSGSLYVNDGATGAVVGELTTTDEDAGDYHNYTLSGSDAAMFEVVSGKLKLKDSVTPAHSTQSTYSVTVTSTDIAGETISEDYTVEVNIAPTDLALDSYNVNESYYGLAVGSITTTDPNSDDEFTYTLSGTDAASFEVTSSGTLKLKASVYADYEVKDTYTVTVTAIDQGGLTFEKTLTIDVNDLNYATPYCSDIRPDGLWPGNINLSGDNDIDALLIGFSYDDGDSTTPLTITYSLITTNSVFHPDYINSSVYSTQGYEGVPGNVVNGSDAWETLVDQAFAYWSQVSGINFVKVEETATQCGDIRIGLVSSWGSDEVASGFSFAGNQGINDYGTSGDIWCLSDNDPESADNLGITASATIVHEIGHSLGLAHPHDDIGKSTIASTETQLNAYTLMSYSGASYLLSGWDIDGDGINEYEFGDIIELQNPAINDIKAIQYLYGMTPDYNEGDTEYKYEGPVYASIYDTGGTDTIDLSFYSGTFEKDITLDLRGGSVSEIGTDEIYMSIYDPDADDWTYQNEGFQISISENTVIENAITGSGDDKIYCNEAENIIDCGDGNDIVYYINSGDAVGGGGGADDFWITSTDFTLIHGHSQPGGYADRIVYSGSSLDLRAFTDDQITSIEGIYIKFGAATTLEVSRQALLDLDGTYNAGDIDGDGNTDYIIFIQADSSLDKILVNNNEGWIQVLNVGFLNYDYYSTGDYEVWFAVTKGTSVYLNSDDSDSASIGNLKALSDTGNPIIPIDIDSTDDNDLYPITDFLDDYEIYYPCITNPFLSAYSQSQIATELDNIDFKTSYPLLENAYDDFIVLPEIGDFENETNTVTDASKLSDLLISDPIDEDVMFLLENFAGDDIITKPTIGMTENNHDEVKEHDLFFNFDQYGFQEGLIYISELG